VRAVLWSGQTMSACKQQIWGHLPFFDHAFDLVVSSLAIHNIRDSQGRESVITEAVRLLKPGGRVAIADFRGPQSYGERLRALGMHTILTHPARLPPLVQWAATTLLTAQKPAEDA